MITKNMIETYFGEISKPCHLYVFSCRNTPFDRKYDCLIVSGTTAD